MGLRLYRTTISRQAFVPQSVSGSSDVNGTDIDLSLLPNPQDAVLEISTGAAAGSPSTTAISYRVQCAPDSGSNSPGSYVDVGTVSERDIIAWSDTAAAIAASAFSRIGLNLGSIGSGANSVAGTYYRWLRVVITPTFSGGTSPSVPTAANFVFGQLAVNPST